MKVLAVCVFVVAVVGLASCDCTQDLTTCAILAEGRQRASFANFNFSAVCGAIDDSDSCYVQHEEKPECRNYSQAIENLRSANSKNFPQWCGEDNPRQPNRCTAMIEACYVNYTALANSATSTSQICSAVNTTRACLRTVECPQGQAGDVVNALENILYANATAAQCSFGTSVCENSAEGCISAVEANLTAYEQAFDFDGLCSIWAGTEGCYNRLINSAACAPEKESLRTAWNAFSVRYSGYCTDGGKAAPCLATLETCTQRFNKVKALPQFSGDPLYQCRATGDLVQCWERIENMTGCPPHLMDLVGGLANQRKIETTLQHQCGSILTACTYEAASCVIEQDLAMAEAGDALDYDRVCQSFIDQGNCVKPYIERETCKADPGGQVLLAEQLLSVNESAVFCNASSPSTAQPCLLAIMQCAKPYADVLKNGIGLSCSQSVPFSKCVEAVTCPGPRLETVVSSVQKQIEGWMTNKQCSNAPSVHQPAVYLLSLCVLVKLVVL